MKFAIIASKKDKAGMNIASHLSNSLPIYYTEKEIIYAENIDKEQNIDADFIIFISKHKGMKGKMLSMHAPGNWNKAEMGGKNREVCRSSALFLKHLFKILNKKLKESREEGWQATLEATHHGPYIEKPCCFIEIGSSEKEWPNEKAGKIIAETIKQAVKQKIEKYETAIGIGGPHYMPSFSKIQLNSNYALSHIIPQYAFPITKEMIQEAMQKTEEKVFLAILDWKGMKGEERQEVVKILEQLNLKYKRTSEIEK